MLRYVKYLVLFMFMSTMSGCYVRHPSVGIDPGITIEVQKRPRYRYINKYVCVYVYILY